MRNNLPPPRRQLFLCQEGSLLVWCAPSNWSLPTFILGTYQQFNLACGYSGSSVTREFLNSIAATRLVNQILPFIADEAICWVQENNWMLSPITLGHPPAGRDFFMDYSCNWGSYFSFPLNKILHLGTCCQLTGKEHHDIYFR